MTDYPNTTHFLGALLIAAILIAVMIGLMFFASRVLGFDDIKIPAFAIGVLIVVALIWTIITDITK
jgi:Na+/melibiose symporter-like transporter